jgi:hypothetical protein
MTAPVETPTRPSDPSDLHAHFLTILPRIETHARVRFRHLRCPGRRDDAVAEVIAVTWKWYLRLQGQGKDVNEFVSALAGYAVRRVRSGRRVCGQERAKDVLSPRARERNGLKVEGLSSSTCRSRAVLGGDPHGQDHADAFEERLRDNTQSPVAEQVAFRLDYPAWLAQLGRRRREIAEDMALEGATLELAARHKLSPGRISQLRRELHADWRKFCGEPAAS